MEIEIQTCNCSDCNGPRLYGPCYHQTNISIYVPKTNNDTETLSPTIRKRKNSNTKIENK